jgi:flagellar biogenesis protein FliO
MWYDLLKVVVLLVLLLPAIYLVTKVYAQKSWGKQKNPIKPIGVFSLGTGKHLYLIEVSGTQFLIGVTAKEITMLAQIGKSSSAPADQPENEELTE